MSDGFKGAAMKMTLTPSSTISNEKLHSPSETNRPPSPNNLSPRSSPRPSPHPASKREHTTSRQSSKESKLDGTPSSHDGSICSRSSNQDASPPHNTPFPEGMLVPPNASISSKDKRERRTKKKTAWWTTFYPTYKSRSTEFRNTFQGVPEDERLIVDYSCALQRDILAQGRLYVTQNYLCFYANILGWVTDVTIKWKDVSSLTKEKTAMVFPNAITIYTNTDIKYFFTSFGSRDQTYMNMFRVWQNALMGKQLSQQELWQWVHQCYGDELYLTSDDEDYVAPRTEDEKLSSARLSLDSFSEQEVPKTSEPINMVECMTSGRHSEDEVGIRHRPTPETNGPTDMSDTSESDGGKAKKYIPNHHPSYPPDPFNFTPINNTFASVLAEVIKNEVNANVQCTSNHEGRQLVNEVFPIHIDQLFTLLFTSSKFYLDFQASRKTTDLTQTPWTHNPDDDSKTRIVHSTMSVSQPVGSKTAQLTETQTMLPCSKAGQLYSIDVVSVQAGLPYADSFNVIAHYCLEKISDAETLVNVYSRIVYRKSVWSLVKGVIERTAWSNLENHFGALIKALHAEGEAHLPGDVKRKSRRKRRIHSMPRTVGGDARLILGANKNRLSISHGIFSSDIATLIVFTVLILLVILNVMLYYKLWSLEEAAPYTLVDFHTLENPPKSHDEWIKLLQDQENVHGVEIQKWQRVLKTAIQLLKQTEESLNELQKTISPAYTNMVSGTQDDTNLPLDSSHQTSKEL